MIQEVQIDTLTTAHHWFVRAASWNVRVNWVAGEEIWVKSGWNWQEVGAEGWQLGSIFGVSHQASPGRSNLRRSLRWYAIQSACVTRAYKLEPNPCRVQTMQELTELDKEREIVTSPHTCAARWRLKSTSNTLENFTANREQNCYHRR